MKLVFMHGWSFDHSFWAPLLAVLGPCDALCLDHGYTGAAQLEALPDEDFIAIGHSAGVLWFLNRDLPHCRGMIAFNGFARFSQSEDFAPGIPRRVLTRMQTKLHEAPASVVTPFRQQFTPFLPCPATLDGKALEQGLAELIDADGRPNARNRGETLLAVQGSHDPLVSSALHEASFATNRRLTLEGGHLHPQTAPQACADLIHDALRDWA